MRVGVQNAQGRALTDEIAWAAVNGYTLFDLHVAAPDAPTERGDWRAVAAQLQDNGLAVICRAADYLPVESPSPIVRQAALDELRRTLDVAQVVGAPLCTFPFKGWPHAWPDAAGYEAYNQLLQILVRHGAERGVQVALENGLHSKHEPKYLREIFKRAPQAELALDVGRLNVGAARSLVRDYLFAFADRLRHVRLSDNDGSADQRLPFGAPAAGGIDLVHTLHELKAFGYSGDFSLVLGADRRWVQGCRELVEAGWAQSGRPKIDH